MKNERAYTKNEKIREYKVNKVADLALIIDDYIRNVRSYSKSIGESSGIVLFDARNSEDGTYYIHIIYRCDDGKYRKFITSCEFKNDDYSTQPVVVLGRYHERARILRETESTRYKDIPTII